MDRCRFCHFTVARPCHTEAGTVGCRKLQERQKRDQEEKAMHVYWMTHSEKWPRWPVLPLKNRTHPAPLESSKSFFPGIGAVGFLVAGKGPIVHRGSIYEIDPGGRWDAFSREMYETAEALFAAGWRVD